MGTLLFAGDAHVERREGARRDRVGMHADVGIGRSRSQNRRSEHNAREGAAAPAAVGVSGLEHRGDPFVSEEAGHATGQLPIETGTVRSHSLNWPCRTASWICQEPAIASFASFTRNRPPPSALAA